MQASAESRDVPGGPRPGLAIIANVLTPYRVALHERIVRELPGYRLHTLLTHSFTEFRWEMEVPEQINVVSFAEEGRPAKSAGWRYLRADWAKAGRILRYIQAHGIKVIILGGYSDLTRLRLLRACRSRGIAVFLRGDSNILGDTATGLKTWLKKRLVRWAVRQAAAVMPMGELGRQYFEKYGADKYFIVPYEPDYRQFQQADEVDLQAFCAERGLDGSRRHLLFSGRLVPVKRADLLVDAFAALADKRQEWDLLIAGDGALRSELAARVPAHLADRVKWLGFCEMDQLRLAYRAADVLVHPSEFEPWALVIQEAMAAGLVVVSSHVVGAAREMVEPGRNGEIFESGDLQQLVSKLLLVTDPQKLEGYKANVEPCFEAYRKRADPVDGIRQALAEFGPA